MADTPIAVPFLKGKRLAPPPGGQRMAGTLIAVPFLKGKRLAPLRGPKGGGHPLDVPLF